MRVLDLQEFLSNFTASNKSGTRNGNAVSNAILMVEVNGRLHDIRRMEVQENSTPILGQKGHLSHRLVLKTEKPSPLIMPSKLLNDY
tara:strand:- start:252 stop:512 length:261 start_codon:yes stop_codon:yes gene_type:complete